MDGMTLAVFQETILTPWLLEMFGLPDTDEGRAALDALVKAALAEDAQ